MTGLRFFVSLAGVILAGVGIASTMIVLADAGRYVVLTDRIKAHLIASIVLVAVGIIVILVALVAIPRGAWAQQVADGPSPPAGWVKAKVSTCAPYNPSSCQYRTVWLRDRAWCGKSTRWWSPGDSTQTVQVWCGK